MPTDALLTVERTQRGHAVTRLRRGARLAPRILATNGTGARACLVPTQAGPLAGDHDGVRIAVGPGATLIVGPVAATLALPGTRRTRIELDIAVAAGGRLVLEEAPLIVAAGADVVRRSRVRLAVGAIVALRDTVVLGRAGEPGGRIDSVLRVTGPRGVVLHDALRCEPSTAAADAYVALAPGDRVAATLCLLGPVSPPRIAAESRVLALASGGVLLRATAPGLAELDAELDAAWRAWAAAGSCWRHVAATT
jgi:urease accessory protein